jgi:hypothetical protein
MSSSQTNLRVMASVSDREVASVLTSWKDIARYVGRGVRTVQRWERELGFPVRRTKSRENGTTLAIPREIDSWVKSQQLTDGSDRATTLLRELRRENRELQSENRELQSENRELQSENRELRSENRELLRQLVIEQAKVERSHFCWISNDGLVRR